MNVKYLYSFLAVGALALIAWVGCNILGLQVLFGVILRRVFHPHDGLGAFDGTVPDSHYGRPGQIAAVDQSQHHRQPFYQQRRCGPDVF